jgi:hypothetical protein
MSSLIPLNEATARPMTLAMIALDVPFGIPGNMCFYFFAIHNLLIIIEQTFEPSTKIKYREGKNSRNIVLLQLRNTLISEHL